MKKLLLLTLFPLLFLSCEWFKVDVVEYLDYYTNTAAIDSYVLDGEYPVLSEVSQIPSDKEKKITFNIRNPQEYVLEYSFDWVNNPLGDTLPIRGTDYTVTNVTPNIMVLTLTETFLQALDTNAQFGDVSASIALTESSTGRVFQPFTYSLIVNTPPVNPDTVVALKNEDYPTWVLAFDIATLEERQGIHTDIRTIRINGEDYPIDIINNPGNEDDGKISLPSGSSLLSTPITKDSAGNDIIMEDSAGQAFFHTENALYFISDAAESTSPTFTISFIDSKGLQSEAVTIGTTGIIRSHYYVRSNGVDTDDFGTVSRPFQSVQRAVQKIQEINDGSTNYTINVMDEITFEGEGGLVTIGSNNDALVEMESETPLNITLQGYGSGSISGQDTKRVLYVSGSGVNLTLGENLTIKDGNANLSNTDQYVGAGVLVENNATFTLDGATIQDNSAVMGGGIAIIDSTANIKNGLITENTVLAEAGLNARGGGVFVTDSAKVYMSGATISNNTGYNGGGVYVDTNVDFNLSGNPIVFDNLRETGNVDKNNLSFMNDENNSPIKLDASLTSGAKIGLSPLSGNVGDMLVLGKGYFSQGDDIKFDLDTSTASAYPKLSKGNLIILDTLPHVYVSGGGDNENIGNDPAAPVADFATANSRIGNSGTIWVVNTLTVSGTETWDGNENVTIKRYGGTTPATNDDYTDALINVTGGTLTLQNITIDGQGGGTLDETNSDLFAGDGNVTANAPLIQQTGGKLIIGEKSFLQNNNSTLNGGAIHSSAAIEITGGTVRGNNATLGGGIYLANKGTLLIDNANSTITQNTSNEGAGAYVMAGANFTMSAGRIHDNIASDNGGAVAVVGSLATFSMSGGEIAENIAVNYKGGGVFVDDAAQVTLSGTAIITENSTKSAANGFGGGVAVFDGSIFEMKEGIEKNQPTISKNTAAHSGAGVYLSIDPTSSLPPRFSMSSGSISFNEANNHAGGVNLVQGQFTMSGGKITSNTSDGNAAGVLVGLYPSSSPDTVATFTMENGTITDNKVPEGSIGGGVYLEENGELELSGSPTIKDNGAGGIINVSTGELTGETPNNVLFANSDANISNIKIDGDLTLSGSDPQVGLSPQMKTNGSIIVQNKAIHTFDEKYFFRDDNGLVYKEGSNLKLFSADEIYLDGESDNGKDTYLGHNPSEPVKTFKTALSRVNDGGTIWIKGTVTVSDTQEWNGKPDGRTKAVTIKRYDASENGDVDEDFTGNLIVINGSGKLTLTNITIDGMGGNTADFDNNGTSEKGPGGVTAAKSLVSVSENANLIISSGTVIQNNNYYLTNPSGGGVHFTGNTLEINGGKIVGNKVTIPEGPIYHHANGGGVFFSGTNFYMKGTASITYNNVYTFSTLSSHAEGGGVYISSGTLEMSDTASITNNSAISKSSDAKGGGVYIFESNAELKLSGKPTIIGNTGASSGVESANNVYFTSNDTTSPIKIVGDIENTWNMGLSPLVKDEGTVLMEKNSSGLIKDGDVIKLKIDTGGTPVLVGDKVIFSDYIGAGASGKERMPNQSSTGIVFYFDGTNYYEVSEQQDLSYWSTAKTEAQDLVEGGMNDWVLPELEMLQHVFYYAKTLGHIEEYSFLWSSTQGFSDISGYAVNFSGGSASSYTSKLFNYRAIRSFTNP